MRIDVEKTETAERSLDEFINRRSKTKKRANDEEALWAASTRHANEKRREANRWRWIDHHGHMNRLHLSLAAEHADRRSRLLIEGGHGVDDSPSPPEAA